MTAPYNPPVKGEDLVLTVGLRDALDNASFKINPTLASGDCKISKNNGALADLNTLPSVAPSGSACVMVTVSATEANTDGVTLLFVDQTTPKEWADFMLFIPTT